MSRRARFDEPACLHHVMNRGLARRTIFESRTDARYFRALLARAHRHGRIELHACSLMSTHFRLLIRSVDGRLSETMRWVLNRYVQYFNRPRRRHGPLMRGRFRSILGGSAAVASWAERKARLADGTPPGLAVLDPATAAEVVDTASGALREILACPGCGRMRPALERMRVALLRDAAGQPLVAIAARIGVSAGTPQKLYRLHRECIADRVCRDAYTALVQRALEALHAE